MSEEDRITVEELRYLSIFSELTGAMAYRCIEDESNNRLIFLVKPEDMGRAIGRGGRNIRLLEKLFGKNVEVVQYADDLETMVKNLFPGVKLLNVNIVRRGQSKIVYVKVAESDLGKAIGRGGRNSNRARLVLRKLFNVDNVIIR
ncbi:MAG: NusA-like transcription termination signal-binding factor [Desulfurococcales archaeon]|nr:NusA-like transcription termination signal-binding factor [Desulfurococcales archaeon]